MLDPRKEYLETTIRKIKKNEILLPDFQRQFVWKEEEIQKKLVASVLTRLPIGSILLLRSNSSHEYSCKPLGTNQSRTPSRWPGRISFRRSTADDCLGKCILECHLSIDSSNQ